MKYIWKKKKKKKSKKLKNETIQNTHRQIPNNLENKSKFLNKATTTDIFFLLLAAVFFKPNLYLV